MSVVLTLSSLLENNNWQRAGSTKIIIKIAGAHHRLLS